MGPRFNISGMSEVGWLTVAFLALFFGVPELWRRGVLLAARRVVYQPLPAPLEGDFAQAFHETQAWALERGFQPGVAVELRVSLKGESSRLALTGYWRRRDGRVALSLLTQGGRFYYDFDTSFEGVDLTTTNYPGHLGHPCVFNERFRVQVFPGLGLDELYERHREAMTWLEHTLRRPPLAVEEVLPWMKMYQKRRMEELSRCPLFPLRFWLWLVLRRRYLNRPVWEISPR